MQTILRTNDAGFKVYRHTTPSGKVYIGITKQELNKRWKHGKGYELCKAFYRAIQKYGWDAITHEVVADGLTKDEACRMEQMLIAKHESDKPEHGYNLTSGGEHYVANEESRTKLSESLKRYYADNPSAKSEISRKQIGRSATIETRQKMSEARRAFLESHPQAKAACGNSFRGKKRSEETKAKMSANSARKKEIVCVDTGKRYESVSSAAKELGISRTSITNVLCGYSHTAQGKHFEYCKGAKQ